VAARPYGELRVSGGDSAGVRPDPATSRGIFAVSASGRSGCRGPENPETKGFCRCTPNGIRTRAATLRGTPKALTANRDGRQQARSRGSSERADVGAQGEPQRPRDIREMGRVHLPHSLGCPREPKPRVLRHETIALIAQIGNAPSCAELVRRARRRDDPTVTMMFTDLLGSTEL